MAQAEGLGYLEDGMVFGESNRGGPQRFGYSLSAMTLLLAPLGKLTLNLG